MGNTAGIFFLIEYWISCSVVSLFEARSSCSASLWIMNMFLNFTKIIALILAQDDCSLFPDFFPKSQVQAENPSDMFKISSTLTVMVHICIDGLAVISLGWYAGYVAWDVLTFHLTLSLYASPALPLSFIPHLQLSADLTPSLKSLWILENIPRSAATDELILTLCCCTERYRWVCQIHHYTQIQSWHKTIVHKQI